MAVGSAGLTAATAAYLHVLHILRSVHQAQLSLGGTPGFELLDLVYEARVVDDVVQAPFCLDIFKMRGGLEPMQGVLSKQRYNGSAV